MYKILLVIGLLVRVQSFRVAQRTASYAHSRSGSVCKISERTDTGRALYHISFTLNVGRSCNNITTCNFFKIDELATNFLETPTKTPANGKIGKCKCNLKETSTRNLPALPDSEDTKTLLEFVVTDQETCSEYKCWRKYNSFLHHAMKQADKDSKYRDASTDGNHWEIGCATGVASLEDLKSIGQLQDEASEEQRMEMIKSLTQAGILPSPPAQTVEEKPKPKMRGNFKKVDLASLKKMAISTIKRRETIAPVDKDVEAEAEAEASKLESKCDRIEKSVELLTDLEFKLAKMLADAYDFAWITGKMEKGEVDDATLAENLKVYELLGQNKEVIVRSLNSNVDILDAFNAATEFENAQPAALEAFLIQAKQASVIQRQIVRSLEFLIENGAKALENFKQRDGASAHRIATHILEQLGQVLKPAVNESKRALQDALDHLTKSVEKDIDRFLSSHLEHGSSTD